jgi:hypothetical protein
MNIFYIVKFCINGGLHTLNQLVGMWIECWIFHFALEAGDLTQMNVVGRPWTLQGKIVLVTGGDSGTGCAVGVHFSAEGATVAFTHVPGIQEKTQSNFSKSTRLLLIMIPSRLLQILDLTTTT